jgi:hypothetical protein
MQDLCSYSFKSDEIILDALLLRYLFLHPIPTFQMLQEKENITTN